MKQPNLAQDGLDIRQAAEMLGMTDDVIGYAVSQGDLKCGIMARGWGGHCKPDTEDARWNTRSIGLGDERRSNYARFYTDRNSGKFVKVKRISARMFWYLCRPSAYELIIEKEGGPAQIPVLEPYDGEGAHAEDPDAYPTADAVFWPRYPDNDRIYISEIIFLKPDIEEYRIQYPQPAVINKELPDNLPYELMIAIRAAEYANTLRVKPNGGYIAALKKWLDQEYPDHKALSNAARARIATIANPNKRGGAPSF